MYYYHLIREIHETHLNFLTKSYKVFGFTYRIFRRISPPFLNFWWSKVWGGGLYDEHTVNQQFPVMP